MGGPKGFRDPDLRGTCIKVLTAHHVRFGARWRGGGRCDGEHQAGIDAGRDAHLSSNDAQALFKRKIVSGTQSR